jgi:hypothetical protein
MDGMRFLSFVFLFLFVSALVISSISVVSAVDIGNSQAIVDDFINAYQPIFQALFGGNDYSGYLLFEKFLLFIILVSLVYVSLSRVLIFDGKKAVVWVISFIVPLLSIRFINFQWVNAILLSYGVLGIALTGVLPFLIYFFFLHGASDSIIVRKMGWVFFIVIYIGLWITTDVGFYGQVYLWTIVAAIALFFLDGTIHKVYLEQQMKSAGSANKWVHIARLRNEIDSVNRSSIPVKMKDQTVKKLQKQIDRLYKM